MTIFRGGHFLCEAEPVEMMNLIEADQERVAAHMACLLYTSRCV